MTFTLPPRVLLVCAYAFAMPLLAGMPRGGVVPFLRPSEILQIVVTASVGALAYRALLAGERWRIALKSHEWFLLAMAFFASAVPLIWLKARSLPITGDDVSAVFPIVKYSALYFLFRFTITTAREVRAVLRALVASGLLVSVIAVAQVLGVGPLLDILDQFFVSNDSDDVFGGRATTTLGSSIATGAFLAMTVGLIGSLTLATRRIYWLVACCVVGLGALASGQAGTVIMLVVVVAVVAWEYRAVRAVATAALPIVLIGSVALWPVLAARLADIDGGTGLPQSWVIRWSNLSDIYWPQLADGGWLLGVSPDAIVAPVDVFRDEVFIESGYLWLLWVGGLPLLIAMVAFLWSSWAATARGFENQILHGTADVARVAARSAIALVAVLSIIDPHLTLRGGADFFFMIVAVSFAPYPPIARVSGPKARWSQLIGTPTGGAQQRTTARLQIGESKGPLAFDTALFVHLRNPGDPLFRRGTLDARTESESESEILLVVRDEDQLMGVARLRFVRRGPALHGLLMHPIVAVDGEVAALLWRGIALVSGGLRLDSLARADQSTLEPSLQIRSSRSELLEAARMSAELEHQRQGRAAVVEFRSKRERELPAVRLEAGHQIPAWKRASDVTLSLVALLLCAPAWVVCAYLVRRSSEGPVLFRQQRVGAGGIPFQVLKFRTMFLNNDDSAHRAQNKAELAGDAEGLKDADDPRITRIGKFLRRSSLDELPQLINVLQGSMSLVGPRPSLLWEVEMFPPKARRRLQARPGVTGLWQINGRGDVAMNEMLELDLEYLDHMGPATDMRCLLGTAASVVAGEGAK